MCMCIYIFSTSACWEGLGTATHHSSEHSHYLSLDLKEKLCCRDGEPAQELRALVAHNEYLAPFVFAVNTLEVALLICLSFLLGCPLKVRISCLCDYEWFFD